MVSHLVFYQLVCLGLLWLCVMLHFAWPSDPTEAPHRPPQPARPPRTRSRAPQPFAGLLPKPHCEACEQVPASRLQAPSAPPPHLIVTWGRRRQVDTARHGCPQPTCAYWGWVGLGNSSANGHPSGGRWWQLHCTAGESYCLETHSTPLHGKRVPTELLVWTVGALAEGLGIRAVARICEVDPHTVLQWLVEAADHLKAFSQYFLHDVHVTHIGPSDLSAGWRYTT